jgi:hypothetical protein
MDTNTPALASIGIDIGMESLPVETVANEIMEVIDKHQLDIREALEALSLVRGDFEAQLLDCYEKKNPPPFPCKDCGVNTMPATNEQGGTPKGCHECYMVHDELWAKAGMEEDEMLCVGCLEKRLGRELIAGDFTDAIINDPDFPLHTPRLRFRLTSGGKPAATPGAMTALVNGEGLPR